jgi:hypothetical protein
MQQTKYVRPGYGLLPICASSLHASKSCVSLMLPLFSVQAGLVTPAVDAVESAKARRKRKQRELQQAGSSGEVRAAAWANAKVQQRVYGTAWLAFLLMDLPDDIYRKVRPATAGRKCLLMASWCCRWYGETTTVPLYSSRSSLCQPLPVYCPTNTCTELVRSMIPWGLSWT